MSVDHLELLRRRTALPRRSMSSKRIEPGPGQESVWDYPRPPACEPTDARVQIYLDGEVQPL